jgi:hypothetical protein
MIFVDDERLLMAERYDESNPLAEGRRTALYLVATGGVMMNDGRAL